MKFSRITTKKVTALPVDVYKKLYGLNMGRIRGWSMRPTLVELRHPTKKTFWQIFPCKNKQPAYVHYILDKNNNIAAWALSFDEEGKPFTYFYTRKRNRRKGLGARLAKVSRNHTRRLYNKDPKYSPHNLSSRRFFQKVSR